jgi:heat shock protein HspQ
MAGYQFAHKQTYSRKGNKSNRSSTDVLFENSRVPGNHPHVDNAKLPNLILGIDPADVIAKIDQRIEQAKVQLRFTGKRIQVNTHILDGSVYSYPLKTSQLEIADDATRKEYLKWRELACEFAIKDAEKSGMEVLSIVEHTDEPYPHIHVLSIPKLTKDNPRLDAKHCHVGHVAGQQAYDSTLKQAKSQGLNIKDATKSATNAQTSASKDAMRGWQDKYHEQVGSRTGMARLGPARARMPTAEWKKTQKLAEQLVSYTEKLDLTKHELSQYRGAINDIKALYGENESLTMEVETLTKDNGNYHIENESLKRALSDLKLKSEQDLKSMRENANKEIRRLEDELEQHKPRLRR